MNNIKFLLLTIFSCLLLATEMNGQLSRDDFSASLLIGGRITKKESGVERPRTYGVGVNLVYQSLNFASTFNTFYHTGATESYSQFTWSIGPYITRPSFRARVQIGMGMIFYTDKDDDGFNFIEEQTGSFDAFAVTLGYEMNYYFSETIGVNFVIGKNYNANLSLAHLMVGLTYKLKKKEILLAFN